MPNKNTVADKTINFISNNKYLMLLICATLLLILGIFGNSMYYKGHDSLYHSTVISAYSEQIDFGKGKFVPSKILPSIANGFGYGTGIFYPQLPHLLCTYIYEFVSVFGYDVYFAMKIAHSIALLLSSVTMYYLARKITNNDKIAVISSLILLVFPYRMSEILIRDAFAECFTYVFIPLIILSIFELVDKNYKKFMWLFIIGYIGMFWTHQVLTLYITILTIPIYLYYIKDLFNKKTITTFITSTAIVLIVVIPSIIPVFYHKDNGNYMVFEGDTMGGYEKIAENSLSISDFIIPTNGGTVINNTVNTSINLNINIIVIILIGMTIYYLKKIDIDRRKVGALLISTIIALWMETRYFPWNIMPDIMYLLQFPWRLMTFSAITMSLVAAVCLKKYENENSFSLICIFVIGLILASGLETISLRTSRDLTEELPITYDNYAGLGWEGEYLPARTYYHLDYYNERSNDVIIKSGNCVVYKTFDDVPKLEFAVEKLKEDTTIELPRLFYYGYELKNKNTGEKITLIENKNGFIETTINENGIYQLEYKGIELVNSYKIDLLIIIILITVYFFIKKIYKNKERKK